MCTQCMRRLPFITGPVCDFHGQDIQAQPGGGAGQVWGSRDRLSADADDVLLLASSDRDLRHSLGRFEAKCEPAGMTVSTSKSEARVLCQKPVDSSLQVGTECLPKRRCSSISGSCSRVRVRWSGRSTGGAVRLQQ